MHLLRGEVVRIDRAPVALGAAGLDRDLAGPLLRDDVGHVRLHLLAGLGDDLLGLGIEARHREIVDLRAQIELDDVLVILLEGFRDHRLLGEGFLGVEDHQLRFRLPGLQVVRDHARPLVRTGWAAIGIVGRHKHNRAPVAHR